GPIRRREEPGRRASRPVHLGRGGAEQVHRRVRRRALVQVFPTVLRGRGSRDERTRSDGARRRRDRTRARPHRRESVLDPRPDGRRNDIPDDPRPQIRLAREYSRPPRLRLVDRRARIGRNQWRGVTQSRSRADRTPQASERRTRTSGVEMAKTEAALYTVKYVDSRVRTSPPRKKFR